MGTKSYRRIENGLKIVPMQPGLFESNLTIGTLLANATSNSVKAVLQGCDPNSSFQKNLNTISSSQFSRDKLQDTVAYLHETFCDTTLEPIFTVKPDERNKKGYAKIILNCILKVTGIECLKCSVTYKPHDTSNTTEITCFSCQRPAHSDCYNSSQFDYEIGIVFICKLCMPPPPQTADIPTCKGTDHSSQPPSEMVPLDRNTVSNSSNSLKLSAVPKKAHPPPKEEVSLPKTVEQNPQKPPEPKTKSGSNTDETTFCPLLLKNECPHGISGKNCDLFHPTRCFKYQTYGPKACQKQNCKYYHPKFCCNSLEMKACFDLQCKGLHLPGTKRRNKPQKKTQKKEYDRNGTRKKYTKTNTNPKTSKMGGTCTKTVKLSPSVILPVGQHNKDYAEPERDPLPAKDAPEPALTNYQFFQYLEELRAALKEDLKTDLLQQMQLAMASMHTRMNTTFVPVPPTVNPNLYNSQYQMETPNLQQAFAFPPSTQISLQNPMYTQHPTTYPPSLQTYA